MDGVSSSLHAVETSSTTNSKVANTMKQGIWGNGKMKITGPRSAECGFNIPAFNIPAFNPHSAHPECLVLYLPRLLAIGFSERRKF